MDECVVTTIKAMSMGELAEDDCGRTCLHCNTMSEFAAMPKFIDRKTFALEAVKSSMCAALFTLFDEKPIDEMAWKAVKPKFSRPFYVDDDL